MLSMSGNQVFFKNFFLVISFSYQLVTIYFVA